MCKNQECLQKASTGIEVLCKCLVLILIFCEKVLHEQKMLHFINKNPYKTSFNMHESTGYIINSWKVYIKKEVNDGLI